MTARQLLEAIAADEFYSIEEIIEELNEFTTTDMIDLQNILNDVLTKANRWEKQNGGTV